MKNKYIAAFLAFFFGYLGVHKFYLGRPMQGALYIFFFWISWIFAFFEGLQLLVMHPADFDVKYNSDRHSRLLHTEKIALERDKIKLERLRIKAELLAQENKLKPPKEPTEITGEMADDLAAWHDLYEKGIIDELEYEEKRKIILEQ